MRSAERGMWNDTCGMRNNMGQGSGDRLTSVKYGPVSFDVAAIIAPSDHDEADSLAHRGAQDQVRFSPSENSYQIKPWQGQSEAPSFP